MPDTIRRFRKLTWKILGAAPLWVKIMGIVVMPIVLVLAVASVFVRKELLEFLEKPEYRELLRAFYPMVTWQFAAVTGIAVLMGFLLAFAISRWLSQPLHNLLEVIGQVEQGDYSAKVQVWAGDEIGRVQQAFNAMTERLSGSHKALVRRNRELTLIGKIAESMALRAGGEEVMEQALQNTMTLLDAEVGTVYRISEDHNSFQLVTLIGDLPPALHGQLQDRQIYETAMRLVMETGKLIKIDPVEGSPFLEPEMASIAAAAGIRSSLLAPLKLQGQVVGVINLVRKNEKPFTAEDETFAEGLGSVIGIGMTNIHLLNEVQQKEADLRRALHRAVELQEEERKRLARDLHDETGQALTSILIQLRALQDEDDLETIQARIEGLRYLTAQTLEDLRRLAVDLRPAALDDLGILPALRWYSQQVSERSGARVSFTGPEKLDRLSSEVEIALYRIAQEGVSNAIRHGKARSIEVHLEQRPQALWLTVTDNGIGFDRKGAGHGLGLIGIQERIALLSGRFTIESVKDSGSRMWIEVPLLTGESDGH